MYLRYLNEKEKEAFLILAVKAAKINGVVEQEEKKIINEYCYELRNNSSYDDIKDINSIDEIIMTIKESDVKNKRIILFEIVCLLCIDGVFDEIEKTFAYDIAAKMGLEIKETDEIVKNAGLYIEVVSEIGSILLG